MFALLNAITGVKVYARRLLQQKILDNLSSHFRCSFPSTSIPSSIKISSKIFHAFVGVKLIPPILKQRNYSLCIPLCRYARL